MDPCRFVVFFACYTGQFVLPKSIESGHDVSLRMLSIQFVGPN
jgi:hypothetical protein